MNKTIKILATKTMTFMECESAFHYLDSKDYILVACDINGTVCIWNINNSIIKCANINTLKYSHSICGLIWKNSKHLCMPIVNCDLYKYEMNNINKECNESKEEEQVLNCNKNVVKDNESYKDFDINMGGGTEELVKEALRPRTFAESEGDNENTLMGTTGNENKKLHTEHAAAAKMLGEMAEEVQNNKQNGEEVMEERV